jgi:hypothetical protein
MSHFVVPHCEVRGCNNWRVRNHCAMDSRMIIVDTPIPTTMQSIEICEVHKQLNKTKLTNLLEEP